MSNGTTSIPHAMGRTSAALVLLLSAAFVSIGGCDREVTRPPATQANLEPPQSPPSNVRYRIDPARDRMWVLTRDGVFVYDAGRPKTIVEVPLPFWQSVDEPYSCLPDLALGPRGEAVVTSNIVPTLWRIDPESLAVSVHEPALDADTDKDVGFSGLAYSTEHETFFAVSDRHGSLWRIDPLLKKGWKVALSTPIREACGITVRPRNARPAAHRGAELCIHAEQGNWTVNLSPKGRAANVNAASCTKPLTHLARGEK